MSEDIETSIRQPAEDDIPSATGAQAAGGGASTTAASVQDRAAAIADERPETAVGAAFAGGLLLALILKRIAR